MNRADLHIFTFLRSLRVFSWIPGRIYFCVTEGFGVISWPKPLLCVLSVKINQSKLKTKKTCPRSTITEEHERIWGPPSHFWTFCAIIASPLGQKWLPAHVDSNTTSLHTHRDPFVLKWQHFSSQPPWMMTNVFVSPRLCQISPLKTPAWSLHLTRSSSATGAAADSVGRADKIRFICVNSLCVGSLICLFVWWRLFSRCACPTLVSLCSSCIPPLQMAWRI